jgi:hypothetical protein
LRSQKKVSKEKTARLQLDLRSSVLPLVDREGFLPFGLIPTKPAVLVAANEIKSTLLRNISY